MITAFTNKIDGGVFCNDCASADPTQALEIQVTVGTSCNDCNEKVGA